MAQVSFVRLTNGVNWVPVNKGWEVLISRHCLKKKKKENNGYPIAGTSNGVYVSTDEGNSTGPRKQQRTPGLSVSKVIAPATIHSMALSDGGMVPITVTVDID